MFCFFALALRRWGFFVLSTARESQYFHSMKSITRRKRRTGSDRHKTYYQVVLEMFRGERDELELTDGQYNYLRMLRACYGMLLDVRSKMYIVGRLIETFDISQRHAYNILRDTEQLFGQVHKVDKEINRHISIEMAKETYRLARDEGDLKSMNAANRALIEAAGLNNEDPDLPDFAKLQPSLNIMVLPEGMEQDIQRMLGAGVVNLNKVPDGAETITYEEVREGDQGPDRSATRAE